MSHEIRTETALDLEQLKRFVLEKVIPNANRTNSSKRFPWEIYGELHKLGWLQAFIPQPLGGVGATALDTLCIAREIGYGSTGVFSSVIVNMLAMTPIILYGSETLKRQLCEEFLGRFFLWSYCMTEPDTGSNIEFSKTTAKKVDGGYVITGKKCFITNATVAEKLTVFANLVRAPGERPVLTCFYIPASSPGVRRGTPLDKIGQHDSDTSELFFDDVFVPEAHRIGAEGQGLQIAFHALQKSKTMIAGASVGLCRRAYDLVTAHLAQRNIYARPLLALPAIQFQLAKLQTEARAAWLLGCDAARAWDEGRETGHLAIQEASMAKMFAADLAVKYTNECLELFGGYGYATEFEISRLYRDCKVLEIYEGPTLIQQALISRELFPETAKKKKAA